MRGETAAARVVRFGGIEANLDSGEVLRAGRRHALPDQPLRILVRLLDRPGEIVSRDDLRRELWPDGTFVDFEHGLNSAIKRLRDALGDSADAPRYIETVPRRGYRFVGQLEGGEPLGTASGFGRLPGRRWLLGGAGLALAMVWIGWRTFVGQPAAPSPAAAGLIDHRVLVTYRPADPASPTTLPIARLAADDLIAALSRLDTPDVEPTAVASASSDAAIEAAIGAGARLVVEIVGGAAGSAPLLEGRILDSGTRQALYFSPRFPADASRTGPAAEPLAQALAGAIACHLDHAFGGLDITSAPPGLDGYLEYRAGSVLLDRDNDEAIVRLEQATAMTPDFLLPRLTLVMAYDNAGNRAAVDAEMSRIAGMARLTRAEQLLVEYMTESLARRHASALRTLLEVEKLAPRSWIVNYGIQQEALALNRPRVAIDAFSRLPLHERHWRFNGWRLGILSKSLHLVKEYDRELAASRLAREYAPSNLSYLADEVRPLAARGDVKGLDRVIDASLSTPATYGSPVTVIEAAVRELHVHGRRDDAVAAAQRGIGWLRSRPASVPPGEPYDAALARFLYLAGQSEDAIAAYQTLHQAHPASVEYAGHLGVLFADRLDRQRALDYDEQLHQPEAAGPPGRAPWWRACIAARLGEADRAVGLLRDAFRSGHFRGLEVHQSHEFEGLQGTDAFRALMESTAVAR